MLSCQEIVPLDIEDYGDMQTRMHLNSVTFYDSNTYEKLREFEINQKIKSGQSGNLVNGVSMDLDRDVLMIRIKTDSNKTKTLLWKLQWCDNSDSGKQTAHGALKSAKNVQFDGTTHCLPQRLKSTFFEKNLNGACFRKGACVRDNFFTLIFI